MNDLSQQLLEQHMQLHGLLARYVHQQHGHGPMNPYSGQGRVLRLLQLTPEISQKELAELLGIRPQSLGETLTKLEKKGLVSRTPSEEDKRNLVVRLEAEAAEALLAGETDETAGEEDVFAALSDEEKTQLAAMQQTLIDALSERYGSCDGPACGRPHHGCGHPHKGGKHCDHHHHKQGQGCDHHHHNQGQGCDHPHHKGGQHCDHPHHKGGQCSRD